MTTSTPSTATHTAKGGKGIQITDPAMLQLSKLCRDQGDEQILRVGVRSGGCSGMSYTMDFVSASEIEEGDEVYDYSPPRVLRFGWSVTLKASFTSMACSWISALP